MHSAASVLVIALSASLSLAVSQPVVAATQAAAASAWLQKATVGDMSYVLNAPAYTAIAGNTVSMRSAVQVVSGKGNPVDGTLEMTAVISQATDPGYVELGNFQITGCKMADGSDDATKSAVAGLLDGMALEAMLTTIVQGVAVDSSRNVTGLANPRVTGAGRDTVLRKYTPDGTPVWTRTYGGDALGHDVAFDVSTTANGSLYVAGYETVDGEGRNMWLGKYDTDGNLLWSRVYNGIASLDDQLVGVVAGPEGEAYVCGYASAMDIPWHSFVRRYDADGNIEWTDDFTGDSAEGAHCYGIARTPGGDLIVTGGEIDTMIRDVMMRRYTADGEVRWSRHIPGGALGPDYGRAIATDDEGLIYVTGSIDTGVDARDIWVARVSP